MIAVVNCLRRKPGVSLEDFVAWWEGPHAELVASNAKATGLQEVLWMPRKDGPLARGFHAELEGKRPPAFDGLVINQFNTAGEMLELAKTDDGRRAAEASRADAADWVDAANSVRTMTYIQSVFRADAG